MNKKILNNHGEIPKRLSPTEATLKKLFIKSGNKCAFPSCEKTMYRNDKLIGQVCHIEDAMPGDRWNIENSNEDNRLEKNLMLMCYEHHIETNDVSIYDVRFLKHLKKAHEHNVLNNITPTSLVIDGCENVSVEFSNFSGGSKTHIKNTKNSNIVGISNDGGLNTNLKPEDFDTNK